MRVIGKAWWVSLVVMEVGACGPRVSVGNLGGDTSGSGGSSAVQAGATQTSAGAEPVAEGGSDVISGGGSTASKAGASALPEGGERNAAGGDTFTPAAAGAPPDGCPKTLSQFLPKVVADCPDTAPPNGAACQIAENGSCVWQDGVPGQGGPGYTVMGCYATLAGNVWYGASQGQLGEIGKNPQHCPHAQPDAGSSCSEHAGEHCYFPDAACSCAADDAKWACIRNLRPVLVPAVVQRLCPPDGLDESKLLKDLTDAEVSTWCKWYGDPSGSPRPPVTDNDPPGMALSYSAIFIQLGANACLKDLPQVYCEKSLRLRPDCTATLEQLDDCVESIRAVSIGTPGWVGHGCAPLFGNVTCKNVVVQSFDPEAGFHDCKVPLE